MGHNPQHYDFTGSCLPITCLFHHLMQFPITRCTVWHTCSQAIFLLLWLQWIVFNCKYYFLLWTLETRANSENSRICSILPPQCLLLYLTGTQVLLQKWHHVAWRVTEHATAQSWTAPLLQQPGQGQDGYTREVDVFPTQRLTLLHILALEHHTSKARDTIAELGCDTSNHPADLYKTLTHFSSSTNQAEHTMCCATDILVLCHPVPTRSAHVQVMAATPVHWKQMLTSLTGHWLQEKTHPSKDAPGRQTACSDHLCLIFRWVLAKQLLAVCSPPSSCCH